jgi:hypothetical protein
MENDNMVLRACGFPFGALFFGPQGQPAPATSNSTEQLGRPRGE